PTLIDLAVLAGGLYVQLGLLDLIRGRILARIGINLDESMSARIYQTIIRLPALVGLRNDSAAPMRDLDTVRAFLGGIGPVALFDLPWMPIYIGICFAFHFWIGMTATIGAFVLIVLTVLTEWLVLKPTLTEAPHKNVVIENASVVPPGEHKPVVRDLSLKLQRGNALGVIGPSASGKSSFARMLVGYWAPAQGKVSLDGAALDQWAPNTLGRY